MTCAFELYFNSDNDSKFNNHNLLILPLYKNNSLILTCTHIYLYSHYMPFVSIYIGACILHVVILVKFTRGKKFLVSP